MKKIFLAVLIFLFSPYLMAQSTQPTKNQRYFDINKNIDIFNSVLKELDMFYVDSIKVDSLVQGTVRKMLAGLDPYTEYYSEEEMDDFRFMTTGEYAGIGAVISYKDGHVIINEPYEGLPA
ncbi:MAG: peptidase S41, partial [Dysgonamonadaceae bacterium]